MNRQQFLQQFLLYPQPNIDWPSIDLHQSAVLVALQERPYGLDLILTRRSENLRNHAQQICFAGGRQDLTDISLLHTALRELEEELGVLPEQVEILGKLPSQPVLSRFMIHPYIGFIAADAVLRPDPNEVSEVVRVPLQRMLDHRTHYTKQIKSKRIEQLPYHELVFIPIDGQLIWGATAAIIRRLADQLHPENRHLYLPFHGL
ncbi:NUDIX family protein [Idiomarina sp. A28L]|uniref:CoA pyrophosphatase n=1 Tax=Idiomarina sp. A28L TaxID=1036674 RepID=UPI0002138B61|nr:CoA pyrophosphatase [Idiomarina sp. A28L]EGN74329.1 NUDIX family protein [Idiomarina sp. A28L]